MRLIHCRKCADRAGFQSLPGNEQEPGETVRRVDGKAGGHFICDNCNAAIAPGDQITAWSAWRNDCPPMPAWEHTYMGAR